MRRLAPLLALLLVFSACKVRVELDTTIEADGSGTVAFAVGFDEEFRQSLETFSQFGDEPSPDLFSEMEGDVPAGWDVERFTDGEIEGIRISRDFSDLDDLRAALDETEGFGESGDELGSGAAAPTLSGEFSVERDGDIFSIDLGAPDTGASSPGGDDFFGDENPFDDLEFEFLIKFTLPGEIQDHNAHETDGNTLTWKFNQDSDPTPIRATSDASKSSGSGSDFPIGAVIAILVVIGAGIGLFVWNQNRQKPAMAGGPPPEGTPPATPPPPGGSSEAGETPPPPPPPD